MRFWRKVLRLSFMTASFAGLLLDGRLAEAAFPGGNGKIAFASNRDGNFQIYVMNADGSGQTRLTNNSASDQSPAWSPDGTKIAFFSNRARPHGDIFVMNADGTGQTNLTNSPAGNFGNFQPAWSPDGTKIVFVSNRDQPGNCVFGGCEIFVMNADGSSVTRLTNNPALQNFAPAWSPDGTKIAFVRGTAFGAHDIYVMNPDGSGQTQLTNNGVLVTNLNWSPDGRKITFSRDGFGRFNDIWVMNADGTGQTNLTNTPTIDDQFPAWSPDGTKIAFTITPPPFIAANISVMNADGSAVTRLTNTASNVGPDWQPLTTVPFAAFDVKVEIELGPLASNDRFEVKATFTLGERSDGINPVAEKVTLQVGAFSTTIPAGSFVQGQKGRFKFEGVIGGVKLEARVSPLGGVRFEFKAEGEGADLTGTVNPVTVGLTIGNDRGSKPVEAEFGENDH